MRFAEKDGLRILPNPLEKTAECPLCNSSVIAKCGKIKVWHWAHKNNKDCDNWGGRETTWHLNWKNEFSEEYQEVIIERHRADVKINNIVIEFQSSTISNEDIIKREQHYGRMKWVLNGSTFAQNLILRDKKGYKSFRWKWPPKTWLNAKCPIYIDMQPLVDEWINILLKTKIGAQEMLNSRGYIGEEFDDRERFLQNKIDKYSNKLFLIKKVYNSLPCGGWGKLISKQNFIQEAKDGYYGY